MNRLTCFLFARLEFLLILRLPATPFYVSPESVYSFPIMQLSSSERRGRSQ